VYISNFLYYIPFSIKLTSTSLSVLISEAVCAHSSVTQFDDGCSLLQMIGNVSDSGKHLGLLIFNTINLEYASFMNYCCFQYNKCYIYHLYQTH